MLASSRSPAPSVRPEWAGKSGRRDPTCGIEAGDGPGYRRPMGDDAGMHRAARTSVALSDDRRIFLLAAAVRDAAHSNVAEAVTWGRCVRDRIYPRTATPTVRDRWQTIKNALNNPKPAAMAARGPDLERVLAAWERHGIGTTPIPEGNDDPRRALTERLMILHLEEVMQTLKGPMPSVGLRAAQELHDAIPPPPPGLDPAVVFARAELVDRLAPVDNFSDPSDVTRELAGALDRLRAAYYGELVYDEAPAPVRAALFPRGRPSRAQLAPVVPERGGEVGGAALDLPETALLPGDPRIADHVVAIVRAEAAGAWDDVAAEARNLTAHMVTDTRAVPEGPVRTAWMELGAAAADLRREPGTASAPFRQAADAFEAAANHETGTVAQRLARLDPDTLGGLWASFFALLHALGEAPAARAVLAGGAMRTSHAQMHDLDTITRLELDERLARVDAELDRGDVAAAARVADVAVFQCRQAAERQRARPRRGDR